MTGRLAEQEGGKAMSPEVRRALDEVRDRHQTKVGGLDTDIHGEPICRTCGFRDTWPCAPARLADAVERAYN